MPDVIVGIDLGTTNSEVAVVENGQPRVLADDGDPILPSIVGLADDGRLLVGKAARNQWVLAPDRTVKSIKRKMGQDVKVSTAKYTVGPMAELRLPLGFGIEFDMLIKRFKQSVGTEQRTDTSYEFPLLLKYRGASPGIRPYIEGGVTHQQLSGVATTLQSAAKLEVPNLSGDLRRGGCFGAGLEAGSGRKRFSLGLRYSRWAGRPLLPSTNMLDALAGFTF